MGFLGYSYEIKGNYCVSRIVCNPFLTPFFIFDKTDEEHKVDLNSWELFYGSYSVKISIHKPAELYVHPCSIWSYSVTGQNQKWHKIQPFGSINAAIFVFLSPTCNIDHFTSDLVIHGSKCGLFIRDWLNFNPCMWLYRS